MSEILKPASRLPWEMYEDLNHNDVLLVGVQSKTDCGAIYITDHAECEDRQNAAYIVNACNAYPELVEACNAFTSAMEVWDESTRPHIFAPSILAAYEAARAALAKAGVKS